MRMALIERGQQTETVELADRMGEHIDADAERPHFRCGFQHEAGNASLMQHQGERQPADSAPSDDDRGSRAHCHAHLPCTICALFSAAAEN